MNEERRAELDGLKRGLVSLRQDLERLQQRLDRFEAEPVAAPSPLSVPDGPAEVQPLEIRPVELEPPPFIPEPAGIVGQLRHRLDRIRTEQAVPPSPPPLPPAASPSPAQAFPPVLESSAPPRGEDETPARERSFEMKLGTYWLVRIGIVILLTAMVLFGKYAYQNFIANIGPAGRVALLYLGSGALLALGAWMQRSREALRNYGQVLFAGGLAAVYFTTFAAHHLPNLRVISSPLVDGLLLLGWAGFMVFLASRRKSELLALLGIGLAYYSSAITDIGHFTLYSNLLLAAASVYLLARNLWVRLSFLSLIAAYGCFAFWTYFEGGNWRWPEAWTPGDFRAAWICLTGYWLIFTGGVLLARDKDLQPTLRASFATLNNGAMYGLATLLFLQQQWMGFWLFSMGFGAVLIGLAALTRRLMPADAATPNAYLTQGLVMVTVGLIVKFSGFHLALLLAAQSTTLLVLSSRTHNPVLKPAAGIAAALAVIPQLAGMHAADGEGLLAGLGIVGLMGFNSWWAGGTPAPASSGQVRWQPGFYCALALATGFLTIWKHVDQQAMPVVLAACAIPLVALAGRRRLREFAVFGQGYVWVALAMWLPQTLLVDSPPAWWVPAILLTVTLALTHWWQHQSAMECGTDARIWASTAYALAGVAVLHLWIGSAAMTVEPVVLNSAIAVAFTIYGALTRTWALAGAGQIFTAVAVVGFFRLLFVDSFRPIEALTPAAAVLALSAMADGWLRRRQTIREDVRGPVLEIARAYRWLALAMFLFWVNHYIALPHRFWVLTLAGLVVFGWAGWKSSTEGLYHSAALAITGLITFWVGGREAPGVHAGDLPAILLLAGQQFWARRNPDRFKLSDPIHDAVIVGVTTGAWLLVSRWVLTVSGGFYLTLSWGLLALALFLIGLAVRERMYRWAGLGILACALGRVALLDVWKLETPYRIVTLFALGIVLLLLGFIYNRFQERIRRWL